MNTDVAQLCAVLRSLIRAMNKGKFTKKDETMCHELLNQLEHKYRAGVAAIKAAAIILPKEE